jgi:Uma2 family endonuclease
MSTAIGRQHQGVPLRQIILPLMNGDRLSAEEFERRYDAMPELKKAELINGVVYMAPPVYFEDHGGPHFDVSGWLYLYSRSTPGIRGADNSTLRLPKANRPQPDTCLIILPTHGGQSQFDDKGCIVGGPELIVEVAATSANYDLHDKLDLYRRNKVREYVVWRVIERAVDWFVLRDGQYDRLPIGSDGIYRSTVLPGLWLDPTSLIAGDVARVDEVALLGIASPEHTAFVEKLNAAAKPA